MNLDTLLVGGLTVAALVAAALAARGGGLRLYLALFSIAAIVGGVSLLIEAVAFGVLTWPKAAAALAWTTGAGAVWCALAFVLSGKVRQPSAAPTKLSLSPLRLLGVIVAYLVLYLTAGALIYPLVAAYYADLRLPSMPELLALQVGRSLLIGLAAAPLLSLRPRFPELTLGLLFAVVGGIAPLSGDSGGMPEAIRAVHMVEVGISNFLFGAVVAWLLKPRHEKAPAGEGGGSLEA